MRTLLPLLAAAAMLLAACGPSISTYRPTQADLSAYQTFAYLPNTPVELADREATDDVNRSIISAIREQMQQEGYAVDQDNPDLLLLVETQRDTEVGVTTDPVYGSELGYAAYPYATPTASVSPYYNGVYYNDYVGYNDIVGYDRDTYRYKEGSLIVSLVDRETRNTVWRGVAEKDVYGNSISGTEIAKMVDNLFKEYPNT